jgi:hypothetical protein
MTVEKMQYFQRILLDEKDREGPPAGLNGTNQCPGKCFEVTEGHRARAKAYRKRLETSGDTIQRGLEEWDGEGVAGDPRSSSSDDDRADAQSVNTDDKESDSFVLCMSEFKIAQIVEGGSGVLGVEIDGCRRRVSAVQFHLLPVGG